MLVKYIEYDMPGFFFNESKMEKFDGEINWPNEHTFAYRIGEREEVEKGGETLTGQMKWGKRHIRGKKMSKEDVEREVPDCHILVNNMENNGWDHVIKCPAGNFQPREKDDIYIS